MALRSFVEQRRHERVDVVREVSLRLEGSRTPLAAQLIDLSQGGLRAVAALPEVAIGAPVCIDLLVPAWIGSRRLSLPAVLVRLGRVLTTSRHRELALELRAQPADAERLAGFVRRALRARRQVASVQGQDSPLADAMRMVRVSLGPAKPDRARVVVVASAAPAEGKSFSAAHLATLLASEGQRVLLVDADLRSPTLARSFGAAAAPGLAEWLAEGAETPVAHFVQPTRGGVLLLAAGRGAKLSEGWSREDALAIVERMRVGEWDTVVIDSPPLLIAALSSLLAAAADDVLLVARAGMTRESDLLEARRLLDRHGAKLRGVVLNDHLDSPQEGYGSYYKPPRRTLRQLVQRRAVGPGDDASYELPGGPS